MCHYILTEMAKVLAVLAVDREAVEKNLMAGGGAQVRILLA
jgi:hypothetical protein